MAPPKYARDQELQCHCRWGLHFCRCL